MEPSSCPFPLRELCEVDDRAGKDRCFATQMLKLPRAKAEEPLKAWWPNLTSSTRVWTNGLVIMEYVRGALHPSLVKQLYECSFEELMDQAAKSAIWMRSGLEVMLAAEKRAVELHLEVEHLKATSRHPSNTAGTSNWRPTSPVTSCKMSGILAVG
ncbi:hypothetical protein BHE74_00009951 [Ensete ventricosum]|nr:hypothetical protein GW17_00057709 [Ensete ventricosum]RWW81635.1 hypothetical protein BHE74_00009951 [Ensete ventricosum]